MRKLASIRQISSINPIEGKDRIGLAMIDGWQVIVNKADYKDGDLVVFCEIDSVFPQKEEYAFLAKNNYRIKTMKMAGCISQGICFPLSVLPKGDYKLGDDVTKIIGITQYEETMDVEKVDKNKYNKVVKYLLRFKCFRKLIVEKPNKKGEFPSVISKTDESRLQNVSSLLELDCDWVSTEKLDGSSSTYLLQKIKSHNPFARRKYEYMVCSRNLRLPNKDNSIYWFVSDKYDIENVLKNLIGDNEWVAIQGEVIAPKVQKNKYKVSEPHLYVFNLIYPNGRLGSLEAKEVVEKHGLNFVPIVDEKINIKGMSTLKLLEYADGKSVVYDTLREGLVFRTLDGEKSFKAVSPKFLMKNNE